MAILCNANIHYYYLVLLLPIFTNKLGKLSRAGYLYSSWELKRKRKKKSVYGFETVYSEPTNMAFSPLVVPEKHVVYRARFDFSYGLARSFWKGIPYYASHLCILF